MLVTDAEQHVVEQLPALREFVEAVNDQDQSFVEACLSFTDPRTLAVLAAGWVGELLDQVEAYETVISEAQGAAQRITAAEAEAKLARIEKGAALRMASALEYELAETRASLSDALKRVTKLQGDLWFAKEGTN